MQHLKSYFVRTGSHNVFVFNALLWCASFAVLLYFFSQDHSPAKIDYVYTGSFIATVIPPVFLNLYVLIPRFLKKEKYALFGFFFLINLLLFTQLNTWFFSSLIDYVFSDYYFISYHSNMKVFFIFSVFLAATTLMKISEDWVYLNQIENRALKLENQQIQFQLSSLRAQINPHFLFNSLNVLYSLSLQNKEETSNAIVQLSDILRYVLYDSNTEKITLKKERALILNYLDFQKFRHQETAEIQFDDDIDDAAFKIYPMLLLPLIENSFKHGIKGDTEQTFVTIHMTKTAKEFHFYIENNLSDKVEKQEEKYAGLGLKNIQQNLGLIYPNKHSFTITKTTTTFAVSLKIEIDEY
ncbi:MAG: sensor histidine kinase [Polaribacter sp.]|nr:sensor histidine kinase [Polaribacter sp.]